MLYEKAQSIKNRHQKKDFFDLVQETIEQIYGVEKEKVINAQERFMRAKATCPQNFEEKLMKNEAVLALERLLSQVKAWKSELEKEKDVSRAIFLLTPEKIKKHSLTDFLRMFNYYTNKLLIGKSDPFIEKQNNVYLK
mmetsp:Transcript_16224/g.20574  ORF Transcript_16224/g.20574 Transcript_16224/m.20574 type:complete len:138 (+) Transcript_16224:1676-2089(+)